jgi:hypothetical protein
MTAKRAISEGSSGPRLLSGRVRMGSGVSLTLSFDMNDPFVEDKDGLGVASATSYANAVA